MSFDFFTRNFNVSEPKKLAVVTREAQWSWSELQKQVELLTEKLVDVPKGHPVIIRGQKEAGFVSAILACMVRELPYIPLDRVFPTDRVRKIQEIVGSQVLLQCGEAEALDFALELRVKSGEVVGSGGSLGTLPARLPSSSGSPLVYIIFTSGSTGEPKGVEITRSNVEDLLTWVSGSDYGFRPSDVFINQCSFSFDVSFFDLLASLQHGATLVLNAPEQIKQHGEFTKHLAPLEPTVWVSTPSFLSLALLNGEFNSAVLSKLNRFYLAGEIIHHSLVRRVHEKFPQAKVFNAYGPTEATVIVTLVEVSENLLQRYPSVPIGYVKAGSRIDLIETFEQEGEVVGELVIVGENVARGYYGRPDLTAEKFVQVGGRTAYRTGDHGFYKDGLLFFIGRIDNQIKLHGFRIELDEIDSHIMHVPAVDLSVTIPLVRDGDVKKLVSFVKLKTSLPEAEATATIKAHLEQKVPAYMVPGAFKFVADFPYGASHKIDKKKLLESL